MIKMINIILLAVMMTGCATIQKYWPRPHDPALAQSYVTTKLGIESISCDDKTNWSNVEYQARWLQEYTEFRNDPQKESAAAVVINLKKAKDTSSEKACNIWLDLVKQRLVVLNKAWSGR